MTFFEAKIASISAQNSEKNFVKSQISQNRKFWQKSRSFLAQIDGSSDTFPDTTFLSQLGQKLVLLQLRVGGKLYTFAKNRTEKMTKCEKKNM